MTENEAIELIENDLKLHSKDLSSKYKNGLRMAINALEKQIPKKPNIDGYCGFTSFECPICKHEIESFDYYCSNCGQKLKKTTND